MSIILVECLEGLIALCVKGVEFYPRDVSKWMLEWLFFAYEMRYDKVYMYLYKQEHANTMKVFK